MKEERKRERARGKKKRNKKISRMKERYDMWNLLP